MLVDRGQTISENMGRGPVEAGLNARGLDMISEEGGARNVGGQGQTISENI